MCLKTLKAHQFLCESLFARVSLALQDQGALRDNLLQRCNSADDCGIESNDGLSYLEPEVLSGTAFPTPPGRDQG
jgi:hypothetical protein